MTEKNGQTKKNKKTDERKWPNDRKRAFIQLLLHYYELRSQLAVLNLFAALELGFYVLDMKKQNVRANIYSLSALRMFVRWNILHCTKRA